MKNLKREIELWSFWKIALIGILCLLVIFVTGFMTAIKLETKPIETVIIDKDSNSVDYFLDEDFNEKIKNKDYNAVDASVNTKLLLSDYNYEYLDPNKPVKTKGKLKKFRPYTFQTNSPDALYLYEFYADNSDELMFEMKHGYDKINEKLAVPVDKIICFNTYNQRFGIYRPSLNLKWNEVKALKEANLYWMNKSDKFSNNFFYALSSIIYNMIPNSSSNISKIKAHNKLAKKKIRQQKIANDIWSSTCWIDFILLLVFGFLLIYKYIIIVKSQKK